MPLRPTTGLTAKTTSNFVINAGALYMNLGLPDERVLGATRDGVTLTIEQDIAEIEVDGSPGPFLGGRRIIESRARIESTILEITPENLNIIIAASSKADFGATATTPATHTQITRNRQIQKSDYIANIAIVGTHSGSTSENFIGILYNCLQDGEISLETTDSGEMAVSVTFTSHFDPANMSQEPWELRIPKPTV